MKKLILLATLVITSMSFAADKKADKKSTDKKAAVATTASKAKVTGTVKWTGFGVGKSHTGDLTLKSGTVEMKGEEITGGEFTIDMTSLKTADSEKLQGHLKSPDFFDVEKFKTAQFKITKIEVLPKPAAGAPTHKITGDLTIKTKTHSEEFMATITKKDGKWSAVATTEIKDRTKYDIVYNSKQFKAVSALGDKLIEDNIKIELNITTK